MRILVLLTAITLTLFSISSNVNASEKYVRIPVAELKCTRSISEPGLLQMFTVDLSKTDLSKTALLTVSVSAWWAFGDFQMALYVNGSQVERWQSKDRVIEVSQEPIDINLRKITAPLLLELKIFKLDSTKGPFNCSFNASTNVTITKVENTGT